MVNGKINKMLKSLHISNYALIDTVDITFDNGFNIITGETGAGKSIMLGPCRLFSANAPTLRLCATRARNR